MPSPPHDHNNKYITTQKFNRLTAENVTERLKKTNLAAKSEIYDRVEKTDFDDEKK